MTKMNKTTRKNRRQKGGGIFDWLRKPEDDTSAENNTYAENNKSESSWYNPFSWGKPVSKTSTDKTAEEQTVAQKNEEYQEQTLAPPGAAPGSVGEELGGGNKKHPNPAFGGYLKGGKKHVRNTKKNTKKRTGGNKCNCGCRNCRCSRKDCKCKCADKRFKCTCSSRTCGCKRTLKRRKH
mgnify:CR=1 FL=1